MKPIPAQQRLHLLVARPKRPKQGPLVLCLLLGLMSGLGSLQAMAQTAAQPAARPAAAPAPAARPAAQAVRAGAAATAAAPAGNTLGRGTGPILTLEELRTCFSTRDRLEAELNASTAARDTLNKEKQEIELEQEALRAGQPSPANLRAQVDELGERYKAYNAKLADWEGRVKTFNEGPGRRTGSLVDRQRLALNAERAALDEERKGLDVDRERIQGLQNENQTLVQNYNAKVTAHQQRVEGWNTRNAAWNDSATKLEEDRADWVTDCSNRRYREDDEIAIQRGR
jgi:hypothetical protein